MYVSEITQFINQLKAERPEIVADQAKGRAIWWDKRPQTEEEQQESKQSRVRQKPYVYQTKL